MAKRPLDGIYSESDRKRYRGEISKGPSTNSSMSAERGWEGILEAKLRFWKSFTHEQDYCDFLKVTRYSAKKREYEECDKQR